jgi:hypothetical protein
MVSSQIRADLRGLPMEVDAHFFFSGYSCPFELYATTFRARDAAPFCVRVTRLPAIRPHDYFLSQ